MAGIFAASTVIAAPVQKAHKSFKAPSIKSIEQLAPVTDSKLTLTDDASSIRKAGATPDLNNFFTYQAASAASGDYITTQMEFRQNGNQVTAFGIFDLFGFTGTYNASQQSITFKESVVIPANEWVEYSGENEDLVMYPCKFIFDAAGKSQLVRLEEITLYYTPDGITSPDGTRMGGWFTEDPYEVFVFSMPSIIDAGSAYDAMFNNYIIPLSYQFPLAPAFTFNENEWTSVGNSSLTEGWFSILFTDDEVTYDVETYQKNDNPYAFLLKNPYGKNTPFANLNETPDAEGYIYLLIASPKCAVARPNISSGFSYYDVIGSSTSITATTFAGVDWYINEIDIEDIIADAEEWGDELSTYDPETGLISLNDCGFQVVNYFDEADVWSMRDTSTGETVRPQLKSKVQLPEAAVVGVKGIKNDVDVLAPTRYFNLQGFEVKNPKAGQILIVKQGKNAKKVIF